MEKAEKQIIKNRKIWSEGETNIFIDIWSEYIDQLRKAKRNGHIMAEMAQRLSEYNIKVNTTEVFDGTTVSPPAPSPRTKKRKANDDYDDIKKLIEESSQNVADELKRSNDLLAEANKIENEKLKLVDSFATANIDFQKTLLQMFKNDQL